MYKQIKRTKIISNPNMFIRHGKTDLALDVTKQNAYYPGNTCLTIGYGI